jgi:enediyne biosynthesis protein E4
MPDSGNWLRVALEGTRSNRMGLGARVEVFAGDQRWVSEAHTAGSYLSASDSRVHFGLGDVGKVDRVEVRWPSGGRTVLSDPPINSDVRMRESN